MRCLNPVWWPRAATRSIAPPLFLVGLLLGIPSSAEAFRPHKLHRSRAYSEVFIGGGGLGALSPVAEISGGWLATAGFGFNITPDVGLTLGALVLQRYEIPDLLLTSTTVAHLDVEIMPRPSQFEVYGILGAAIVVPTDSAEEGEPTTVAAPGLRLGVGLDAWAGDWYETGDVDYSPVFGLRAVYLPSYRVGGPVPIDHQLLVDLHFKVHFRFSSNCLNPVGM